MPSIMKCPSNLNNNNQDVGPSVGPSVSPSVGPSVGNLQLQAPTTKELIEIPNPNKLFLLSSHMKSKPSIVVNESIKKKLKLSKPSAKEGESSNKLGMHDEKNDEEIKDNHEEIDDGFNKPPAKKLKGCNVGKSKKVMKHGQSPLKNNTSQRKLKPIHERVNATITI
jgi:hypothetical protein